MPWKKGDVIFWQIQKTVELLLKLSHRKFGYSDRTLRAKANM